MGALKSINRAPERFGVARTLFVLLLVLSFISGFTQDHGSLLAGAIDGLVNAAVNGIIVYAIFKLVMWIWSKVQRSRTPSDPSTSARDR